MRQAASTVIEDVQFVAITGSKHKQSLLAAAAALLLHDAAKSHELDDPLAQQRSLTATLRTICALHADGPAIRHHCYDTT